LKISSSLPFLSLLSLVSVSGCRCGTQTSGLKPDYVATPTALSFSACPTKDENGNPVADVFADVQKVTLTNQGKVAGALNLSITGTDATLFSVQGDAGTSLAGLSSIDLPIAFSPDKKGDLKANLNIDDGQGGKSVVTLIGTGVNLPSQATIETAPQSTDGTTFATCQMGSPLSDCTLSFPDTLFGQAHTLQLKLRNKGCPTLKVTDLSIESLAGDTQGFTIDSPAAPSMSSPLTLNQADGTQEVTVTVRFTPTDDNSGNLGRYATLVIKSNDPTFGNGGVQPARISLEGQAIKPSVYVQPSRCDFANPLDPCGFTTAQTPHDKAHFTVYNDGSTPLQVTKVSFLSTGTAMGVNNRFAISQNVMGQTIAVNGNAVLEVTHTDMPLYVSDQIVVETTIPGQAAGSGGTVTLAVYGGKKPCLTTDPLDQLNFMNPTMDLTTQPLVIKNGANCGTLVVNSVTVDTDPFFSVVAPLLAADTQVPAGGQVQAVVQYKRPPSGGMQLGTLHVQTNDSDFAGPAFKVVQLYSQSPLDQVPTALATGCTPTQTATDPTCAQGVVSTMAANLSMLGSPATVTISGVNSTDDNMVAEYRFTLLPPFPAPSVTTAALANSGVRGTAKQTVLTVPPGATGRYRIELEVWDNRGQISLIPSILNVNVYP
jgi:hypothetical protein